VRFLIDTNIFLEVLLEQEKVEEAKTLLLKTKEYDFFNVRFFSSFNRTASFLPKATQYFSIIFERYDFQCRHDDNFSVSK